MPSTPSRTSTVRRLLLAALPLGAALACSLATHAYASEGSQYGSIGQYGEVTRFGGFDSTAYDANKYDGTLTPGKFLNPVGFAVDTDDAEGGGSSVFVLDRVSGWDSQVGSSGTEWRLQKLSETGAVLGTTEFYLPKVVVAGAAFKVPVGVVGLAVDDSTGQVYTVLYETTGTGKEATQYAYELIGWSTAPVDQKLVAPGPKTDSVSTPVTGYGAAGLISGSSQLAGTPVYSPDGLAIDDTGGEDHVAIAGDSAVRTSGGANQGPAIVAQVSTASGAVTGSWSAASLNGVKDASAADATATAAGLSTADGSLSLLLGTGGSQLDAVTLSANLSDPTVLASDEVDTPSEWAKPLQVYEAEVPSPGASAQAVELSNGLFASDYWINTGGFGYWNEATTEGIRLLDPSAAGGLLSNPTLPPTSIFDTLGNATLGGACSVDAPPVGETENRVTLAAGSNGSLWLLVAGADSSYGATAEDETGREVIELAPGAANPCVGPSGTFTLTDTNAAKPEALPASTKTPLEVSVGSTVDFSASPIAYPTSEAATQAAIYAYEWAPIGAEYTTIADTATEHDPVSTASYQYTTPGVYTAKLKLLGDFGEYDEAGTVIVKTASPPTAAFTPPSGGQAGQPLSFNASGSAPASGAQIADYHWSFGDGQTDDTQSSSDSHTYANPGTYTVTLTVRDNDDQSSAPISHQVSVSSASSGGGGGGTTSGGGGGTSTTTTTTTTTTTGTSVVAVDRSATNVSPKISEVEGKIRVTLSCPSTKVSCAGTISVKTATAVAAKKAKKSVLSLGTASFSLTGGASKTLTIALSAKGASLLKQNKSLKVVVTVSAHDSYGDPLTNALNLTLREPAPKKKASTHKK